MDAAQWHQQGLGLGKPMEEMLMGGSTNPPNQNPNPPPPAAAAAPAGGAQRGGAPAAAAPGERRARPQKEKALNCPRCNSTNTKFCYYNNYSLQQPRYFCKTCRRYWTEGGSLRNVPVGGGSRKNKRSSASSVSAATIPNNNNNKNPKLIQMHGDQQGAHDLNLAFPHRGGLPEFPSLESSSVCGNPGRALSAMELLRSTGCYVPLQLPDYGFALGDFRMPPPPQPSSSQPALLGFSLDTGAAAGAGPYSNAAGLHETAPGRLLFPFEDLKPPVNNAAGAANNNNAGHHQYQHSKDQAAADGTGGQGFWTSNTILGNGTGGPW
ncbi:unnamed protein product [Urochloa humidicola]